MSDPNLPPPINYYQTEETNPETNAETSQPYVSATNADATSAAGTTATMTTPQTLSGIFFEPSNTFDALRQRPRFLVAALILLALTMAFTTLLFSRIDYESLVRKNLEANQSLTAEQRDQAFANATSPMMKNIQKVTPLIGFIIVFAIGAALYLAGTAAMGGKMTYKQALSVWTYSSFAPGVLSLVANMIVLFFKSAEDIDPQSGGRGIINTNAAFLINAKEHPALATFIGAFDLFAIYGLVLAAIGLRRVGKLSSGSAWAVVLTIFITLVVIRVAFSLMTGGAA